MFAHQLKLDKNPLARGFMLPKIGNNETNSYTNIKLDGLSDNLKKTLRELEIGISGAVLFRKKPSDKPSTLHSDLYWNGSEWEKWHCAINWNLNRTRSVMEWYETDEPEVYYHNKPEHTDGYILSGIHYGAKDTNTVNPETTRLLYEYELLSTTLVRTDIPHRIRNLDNKDRWCLSLRLDKNYTWEEVLAIFKPLMI